jgi:DNA-binding MarR family transcriptional regulator
MFQEAMGPLITTGQVAVSQSDGRQFKTTYYLVQQKEQSDSQEGPISPLAMQVLARLGDRAQGARALAKALELDVNVVQTALDELEAFGLVRRSQVGMLVIYRAARGP